MKKLIIILITASILLSSTSYALQEWEEEHEFDPTDFVFGYNDHNTSTYEGDIGLKISTCKNKIDGKTYRLGADEVRSIYYATKKTFKFNEPIIMTHSSGLEPKGILTMKYKNGTIIPELSYESTTLTQDQISYFDDYYNQREIYMEQKKSVQDADYQDTMTKNSEKNKKSKYHRYAGTNGQGVIIDY